MNNSKMRDKLQRLHELVSGKQVFVIGGGPSVKDVNLDLLKDKLVICLNNAYQLFPNATALYWCDESWVAKHYDNILSHPCPLRFTARHTADAYISKDIQATGNATVLKRTGDFGLDMDINCVRGNNSGAHVLNLLGNMRVRQIVLLGYDMSLHNRNSHWHSGHGLPMSNYIYDDLFIPCINSMAPCLKNLKVDVVNCSDRSVLTCFKKQKLEEVI